MRLLINVPQNLNQASKGYHTEVRVRLEVSIKCKRSGISKYPSRCSNKCHMPTIHFVFYRHLTAIKVVVSSSSRDWWLELMFQAMVR